MTDTVWLSTLTRTCSPEPTPGGTRHKMLVADTHSDVHRVEPRVMVGVSENPAKFAPNKVVVVKPDVGLLWGDWLEIDGA